MNEQAGQFQNPKDMKHAVKRFFKSIKQWKAILIVSSILSLISTLLTVFGPMILGLMTTSAVESLKNQREINWKEINFLALILIATYLVSMITSYIQGLITSMLAVKYEKILREKILDKISKMPMIYFDKIPKGDLMSRMINDVDTISASLAETLTQLISSTITVIGYLAIMFYISITLSTVAIIVIPCSMFFISKLMKKSRKYFIDQRKNLGELNSEIEESFSGQLIIKANNHIEKSVKDFARVNKRLYDETWKAEFLSSLTYPIANIFLNLAYVGVCMLGGYYVISGVITIGGIQAFIQYLNRFTHPITEVAQLSATIQQIMAAAERIFDFLEEKEEELDPTESKIGLIMDERQRIKGEVEFSHVKFKYDGKKTVISDFSVKIEAGMQVAIVGPTGAGKTTIVNLLMRFYDPDQGEIRIDGVSTREMKRGEVRDLFGMVLQDTWLFSGTILENLRYGAEKISDDEVYRVAKITGVDHFIRSLPKGYKTEISEDSDNISAGEKQLITITRAVISNPLMMILDEATSNVDTRTEQLIQDAFLKLTKGRTSFVIAHRLSTIREADLILVMREGSIIEQGKHEELLEKKGFYAELYNSQFSEDS